MLTIVLALAPVFLLIALGWILQRFSFPGGAFWPLTERFIYYFLFPVLLVRELSVASLGQYDPLTVIVTLVAALAAMTVLVLATRRLSGMDGPAFTSIFQGALRFNSFVGLAAAQALYGAEGLALFAVAMAVMVPLLNVLCVLALVRYAGSDSATIGRQLRLLATNPLILACLTGIALNLLGIRLPLALEPAAELLGKASVALGLLAVGAALEFAVLRSAGGRVLLMAGLKLVLFPLVMAASARLFGLDGLGRAIVILWAAMPPATSAYILARQLGGDAPLMAAGITVATVLAAFTLPPVMDLLG